MRKTRDKGGTAINTARSIRALALAASFALPVFALSEKEQDAIRDALKDFNKVISEWKCTGQLMDRKIKRNQRYWQEKGKWNWKLADDEVAITAEFENSKFFKSGKMTYDLAKKQYVFTAVNAKNKKEVYRGNKVGNKYVLKLDRSRESLQFTLLHYNRYLWNKSLGSRKVCDVGCTLPGGFAREDTGPKCVVTQGLGTSTVTYQGEKFYICCSGCQDAFNKNPAKYVAEFKAKQKK